MDTLYCPGENNDLGNFVPDRNRPNKQLQIFLRHSANSFRKIWKFCTTAAEVTLNMYCHKIIIFQEIL